MTLKSKQSADFENINNKQNQPTGNKKKINQLNLDKNQNLDKQINSNANKEFLQKNPPKKILQKKSSPKFPPNSPKFLRF